MGAGKSIPGELQVWVLVVVVSRSVIEWRREEGESERRKGLRVVVVRRRV